MTRDDILAQAHRFAEACLERGNFQEAFVVFTIELKAHAETAEHPAIALGFMQLFNGSIATTEEMRKFLRGFH